jgi:chemotaxis methyl-accepting protein methylase
MRNRPEMELICRLLGRQPLGGAVSMAVLACSKGAEVYSILWSVRSTRPDLQLRVQAVDISQEIVDFAQKGSYSLKGAENLTSQDHSTMSEEEKVNWITNRDQTFDRSASIFQRLDEYEMEAMFDKEGTQARIKSWLKEGIRWRVGDASAPELVQTLGTQDVVVANRFLCHMESAAAEKCLRNIARLVKPGGYIFVSGVDLDVRTKVAKEMGWKPVSELMHEIYEGDFSLQMGWPFGWWGLEPFCKDHPDSSIRYASVFQLRSCSESSPGERYSEFESTSIQ